MTHNEKRTHWWKEGLIGLGVGVLYGTTSVAVGHPLDTVKTKMQAQVGFESHGMLRTFTQTLRVQGLRGLYRGALPPLMGSGIFRSTQFAVFEASYTFMNGSFLRTPLPFTGGLEVRVLMSGVLASTARAVIETPLEYIKVRGQVQKQWHLRNIYTGFSVTWLRTVGLMCTYFILVDSYRRHFPDLFQRHLIGPFLMSGVASTVGWWVVWPLEYMKSQVQAGHGEANISLWQRLMGVVRQRGGVLGLYRGLWPGTLRSFVANGCSMIVMQYAQRQVTRWGIRN